RYPQNLCITLCTNADALSRDRKNTGDCARERWIEHFLISSQLQRATIAAGSASVLQRAPHECRVPLLPLLLLLLAERHRRLAGALRADSSTSITRETASPLAVFHFRQRLAPRSRP